MKDNNKNISDGRVTGIYLQINGKDMINIKDLKKENYEKFLESMNELRMAYITVVNHR